MNAQKEIEIKINVQSGMCVCVCVRLFYFTMIILDFLILIAILFIVYSSAFVHIKNCGKCMESFCNAVLNQSSDSFVFRL